MARLTKDKPFIHPECALNAAQFGRFVEVGKGSRITNSTLGDYSYCDRYADIANARVGKFSNIASFARIGPTDHPMHLASQHHFHYRCADYFDDIENDANFFAHRASRVTTVGHDTWIGHGAIIMPEIIIGHGAVVAAGAVVTKDVAPYTIVAGVAAKEIKRRVSERTADLLMEMAWWDWDHDTLKQRLGDFQTLPAEAFIEKYK